VIDLHTHTNESDGSYTPAELIGHAVALKLDALAISDHDTFAGYDLAVQPAADAGLDLVCAIELGARTIGSPRRTVHLLGYFLHKPPSAQFRAWLDELLRNRRERNLQLIDKLQSMGVEITLQEVERVGRTLTGGRTSRASWYIKDTRRTPKKPFASISVNRHRPSWNGSNRMLIWESNRFVPEEATRFGASGAFEHPRP